jgi:HSP20 family protein
MQLVTWEPFGALNEVQFRINDLFGDDSFGERVEPSSTTGVWYPPVDILESKESYLLRAEVPGMKKDDFHIEVKERTLTLSGERKPDERSNGVKYHSVERLAGKFTRAFSLPQTVKQDGIEATYRDGVLEIRVPKSEEAKPRQIEITVN